MEVAALYSGEKLYYKKDLKHSLEKYSKATLGFEVHASQRHSIDPMEKRLAMKSSRLHLAKRI